MKRKNVLLYFFSTKLFSQLVDIFDDQSLSDRIKLEVLEISLTINLVRTIILLDLIGELRSTGEKGARTGCVQFFVSLGVVCRGCWRIDNLVSVSTSRTMVSPRRRRHRETSGPQIFPHPPRGWWWTRFTTRNLSDLSDLFVIIILYGSEINLKRGWQNWKILYLQILVSFFSFFFFFKLKIEE